MKRFREFFELQLRMPLWAWLVLAALAGATGGLALVTVLRMR